MLEAILISPDLYQGPPMVKPPVVQLAGMLRALGRYIDTDAWTWLCEQAGQLLFWPPNVSGWDDTRWLDTSRMRARWNLVDYVLDDDLGRRLGRPLQHDRDRPTKRWPGRWPPGARRRLRDEHRAELLDFARRAEKLILANWQQGPYRAMRQNALLQLIGISPDLILQ